MLSACYFIEILTLSYDDLWWLSHRKLIESVTEQIDTERNHRISQREHSKEMKKLHDRIMQAGLPPLNVDAALVQITGSYTSVS